MKPRIYQLLPLVLVGSVALGTPVRAEAQAGSFAVGAVFNVGGARVQVGAAQAPRPYDQRVPGNAPLFRRDGAETFALSNGYRDGYDKGLDDARDHRAFDPRRHRLYRDGDHGYNRDLYMVRGRYQDIFRRGFLTGYEAGYRDGQRRWHGRDDRDRRDRGGYYDRNGRDDRPPRQW